MKFPDLTRRKIIGAIVLLVGITCLALLTPGIWQRSADNQAPVQSATTKQDGSNKATTDPHTTSTGSSAETPTIESSSPACQQFTLTTAKTVIGSSAALDAQDSALISDTDDIVASSCVYYASADTIRLGVYSPKTSLGESTNTVMFGSEKPPGVQDVPGYGQAAYWDAHNGILSVLKNNTRYELSRNTDTSSAAMDDILQAADVIVPKL